MRRPRPALLPLAALLCGGCSLDFDAAWDVQDLRVLALRAEPPEVMFSGGIPATFPPVRVRALVVDPTAPRRVVDYEWWACYPDQASCAGAKASRLLAAGSGHLAQLALRFACPAELYQAALDADPFKGRGGTAVMLELRVKQGATLLASGVKRVVYSRYGLGIPLDKRPNQNPRVDYVKLSRPAEPDRWSVVSDGARLQATAGEPLTLLPRGADAENYVVAVLTPPPVARYLREHLSYSFFVTSGRLSHASTGGRPATWVTDRKVLELTSTWTPEPTEEPAALWVVVHDNRGGTGWLQLQAEVSAPAEAGVADGGSGGGG